MKRRSKLTSVSARQALGVAGILGLITLTLCSSQNVLARFHTMTHPKARVCFMGGTRVVREEPGKQKSRS
jgi:hypothetical protein